MRFDFAISFAGPQRDIARELSIRLSALGFSVFFDELFEHEMLGRDGADYLNQIFFTESALCIALVSQDYEKRAWAQLERRAAQARELGQPWGFLIPVLCDEAQPQWLLPTRIYFDLKNRSIADLTRLLANRARGHPGGQYKVTAEFPGFFGDHSFSVSSIPATNEFVVWCTSDLTSPQRIQRLRRDATGRWGLVELAQSAKGRYVVVGTAKVVVVPSESDEGLRVYDLDSAEMQLCRVPRNRRWHMVTDCMVAGTNVLLAFCGGDVWLLDLHTLQFQEVRGGSDDVVYAHGDFLGSSRILVGDDRSTDLVMISLVDHQIQRTINLPETIMAVAGFPSVHRAVAVGEGHAFLLSTSDWRLLHSHEILQGAFDFSRTEERALYAFTSGMPFSGNVLQVHDAMSQSVVFRERSKEGGWRSSAISSDGSALVAVRGRDILIFERTS